MPVMSVRLSNDELKKINSFAKKEDKEKSTVARELIEDGFKFKMLLAYREGKVSILRLSKMLDLNLSETIDFLAKFGIEAPISYDDYLTGFNTLKKVI